MWDFVGAVGAVALVVAGITLACWLIGWIWNRAFWMRDGRPELTPGEQLMADALIGHGQTETYARRSLLQLRDEAVANDPAIPPAGPEHIAEMEAALADPILGPELRQSPIAFAAWMLAKPVDDPIRQDYVGRYLSANRRGNPLVR